VLTISVIFFTPFGLRGHRFVLIGAPIYWFGLKRLSGENVGVAVDHGLAVAVDVVHQEPTGALDGVDREHLASDTGNGDELTGSDVEHRHLKPLR